VTFPRTRAADRGAVYVEFLVVVFPVLVVFLGAVQIALLGAARLVVDHAAVAAVRSAAVVLDEEPRYYAGEAKGRIRDDLRPGGTPKDDLASSALSVVGTLRARTRLDVIRRAAAVPLAVLAPEPGDVLPQGGTSVARALGEHPLARLLTGVGPYADAVLAVTFPTAPDSGTLARGSVSGGLVTVRVTYLLRCIVPVVSQWVCDDVSTLRSRRDLGAELARVPSPKLLDALASTGGRFAALRAEATLPRQTALSDEEAPRDR
jgi:hypothetical protein